MAEPKWTKGEWEPGESEVARVEFEGSGWFYTVMAPGRDCPVALVPGVEDWRDDGETTANMRLICAAKHLYHKLAMLVEVASALTDPNHPDIVAARAALSKASPQTDGEG